MQAKHLKKPMEEVSPNKDDTGPKILSHLTQTIRNKLHEHATFPYPTQFLEIIFMIMLILHNSWVQKK